jgi:hypothetical protein
MVLLKYVFFGARAIRSFTKNRQLPGRVRKIIDLLTVGGPASLGTKPGSKVNRVEVC